MGACGTRYYSDLGEVEGGGQGREEWSGTVVVDWKGEPIGGHRRVGHATHHVFLQELLTGYLRL